MNNLRETIQGLVQSDDIRDLSVDIIDNVISEDTGDALLSGIPVVRMMVAIRKTYNSIVDQIFLKKALVCLLEIQDISESDRKKFLKELEGRSSTGIENLLMAIEKLDSNEKASIFGRLCKLRASREITISQFKRLTKCIQDSILDELFLIREFEKWQGEEIDESEWLPILSNYLIYKGPLEQSPIKTIPAGDHEDYGEWDEHISGGQVTQPYFLTDTGKCLLKHFDFLFSS